jgi:hypothetical protein
MKKKGREVYKLAFSSGYYALDQLLKLDALAADCRLMLSADTISTLTNGLSYYIVEVTCNDGTQVRDTGIRRRSNIVVR